MSVPEGWAEGDPSNLPDPPETDAFDVLGNRRRRLAILVLDAAECPVNINTMADILTAAENGHAYRAHDSAERKAIYVGLYQGHAEKLAAAGFAEVAERKDTLIPAARTYRIADRLREQMAAVEPHALTALNRVLDEAGFGRENAPDPLDVSLFRVPTPEQFRALRERAGVTQTALADAIGVSSGSISNFEHGKNSISAETLRAAVEYLRRQGGGPE